MKKMMVLMVSIIGLTVLLFAFGDTVANAAPMHLDWCRPGQWHPGWWSPAQWHPGWWGGGYWHPGWWSPAQWHQGWWSPGWCAPGGPGPHPF